MIVHLIAAIVLLRFVSGLQFPLEYQYDYIGQLSTGIPELRSQVAAVGIRANLTIQITSTTDATAKLTDVFVGLYNDDVDCELRNYAQIEFSPLLSREPAIEEPFSFKLTENEGFVMSVPEREVEWITNIKKSIIEMFIIQPLLGNFNQAAVSQFSNAANYPAYFETEEDSLIGRCRFQYTITQLPHNRIIKMNDEIDQYIDYDIQRNIGVKPEEMENNASELEDILWLASRSMDLSTCHGLVLAQRETAGSTKFEGRSQNKYLAGRSSVGQYVLRGIPGALRMDRAIIEGAHLSNPLGLQQEKIQTTTNQTLILRVVKLMDGRLNVENTKTIHTWRYEMASPFFDPGPIHHQPWINFYGNATEDSSLIIPLMPEYFLTGKVLDKETAQDIRTRIYDLLSETVSYLLNPAPVPSVDETPYDSAAGIIGMNMMAVTRALSGITAEQMEYLSFELFNPLDQKHHVMQMMFMDACIASGDTVAINQIIKLLMHKPHSKVRDFRAATLMMTIGHNVAAPTVVQLLYPYIAALNITQRPLQTSVSLLNFATAAKRVCFDLETYNTSTPQMLFGRAMCDPDSISNLYLPLLTKGAMESPKTWQKAVYIHAIANLKLRATVELLLVFVIGQPSDIVLKSTAIFALSRQYHHDSEKNLIFATLMPLMEDQSENLGIRQDAFMVMLTWQPDAPWWHSLARLTWYEPFGPFAALIYLTIKSMSELDHPKYKEQSAIASMALPLTKPFSPPFHYSFKRYYANYLPNEKIETLIEYSWVTNLENALPKDLFFIISSSFGGLDLDLFEMNWLTKGFQKDIPTVINYLKRFLEPREESEEESKEESEEESTEESSDDEDTNRKIVEDFLLDMKNQFKLSDNVGPPELHLYLKFFNTIQHFIPLNEEILTGSLGKDGRLILYYMEHLLQLNLNKFVVPIYHEYYFPTEMGLPLIHTDMVSFLTFGEGHLLLVTRDGPVNATIFNILNAQAFRVDYHINGKTLSKVISKHTVLIPWDDATVEAGIDHIKAVNYPFNGTFDYTNLGGIRKFVLNAIPLFRNQSQTMLFGYSIPFTAIGGMIPTTNATTGTDFKQIAVEKNRRPIVEEEYSMYSQFTGVTANFQWDSDGNFPVTKGYVVEWLRSPLKFVSLLFHPTIKFWKGAVIYDSGKSITKNVDLGFYFFNLFPVEKLDSEELHHNKEIELTAEDTTEERKEKLLTKFPGDKTKTIRIQTKWIGKSERIIDISVVFRSISHVKGRYQRYSTNVFLLFNRIPTIFESPFTTCVESDIDMPNLPEIITFRERLKRKDSIVPRGQFHFEAGAQCKDNLYASLSTKLRVSESRRKRLNDEMDSVCNVDVHNPLAGFRTEPIYDKFHSTLTYHNTTPAFAGKIGWNIDQFLQGLIFPKATNYFVAEDDPDKIILDAYRNLNADGWQFRLNKPYEKTVGFDIRVPSYVTQIMPYIGFTPVNGSDSPTANPTNTTEMTHSQCIVQSTKVKTFGGEKRFVDLTSCWTLLSTASKHYSWMIFARQNPSTNKTEIKYADGDLKVIAYVSPESAKINGESVSSSKLSVNNVRGEPIFLVHRKKNGFTMSVFNQLKVKVDSSGIIILPSSKFHGKLKGLCGNEGKSLSKSDKCSIKDSKLLTALWTSTRDCSSTKLADFKKKLNSMMKNCTKFGH